MEITYVDANDKSWTENRVQLAEETGSHLYLEYKDEPEQRETGATLTIVENCKQIGLVQVDDTAADAIPEEYIDSFGEALLLSAEYAEQRGDEVYIEFTGSESVRITATLDRGYAY